ncbi:MAG: NAD(P)-binding domain-containing protein [Propionibacteriaceae bacterium]|jgi:glycerol-3-phosphate dehydrogenase (NAD(P)+)|nr:NAD(P)-binding domain-containing protein [Propionibacteriaceae bacterium]
MTTVTILGAGAMGSALATPLVQAGHDVRLWGTHLDGRLVAAVLAGRPHPRTAVVVPSAVAAFDAAELAPALDGADVVVLAVSSVGVHDIATLAAPHLDGVEAVLLTSKGFAVDAQGRVQLLPQTVTAAVAAAGHEAPPVVAVGGPCKANEVAAGQPTAALYAADDLAEAARWARFVSTDAYRADFSADRDGVELCAALKNAVAIALGVADGLTEAGQAPFHNLKAAAFAQGLAEMRALLEAERCDPWTTLSLAGAGDLEVTGLSGRNKVFGVKLGLGQPAPAALAEMAALEQTVEGVDAVRLVRQFTAQRHPVLAQSLPLLNAVHAVVHDGAPVTAIVEAALGGRS